MNNEIYGNCNQNPFYSSDSEHKLRHHKSKEPTINKTSGTNMELDIKYGSIKHNRESENDLQLEFQ